MTEQELRETAPEVWVPTDDDHDPDRVERDKARNARLARGVELATDAFKAGQRWNVYGTVRGRTTIFLDETLAGALIALADEVDNIPPKE